MCFVKGYTIVDVFLSETVLGYWLPIINIAYPVIAVLQAFGTRIRMGGQYYIL